MSVVIETTIGDITVDLYLRERPQTCRNFLALCAVKYYNHCSFHFVQRDFIAQTGDPTGTGSGGESIYARIHGESGRFIEAERKPKLKHNKLGLLSMVNNGENLHGSQFFFTLTHSLDYLDNTHTVFGEVVEGEDVLIKLNDTICDEKHQPYQDILITHTVVLEDPFPKIEGLEIPDASPEYNFDDLVRTDRIGLGEDIDDSDKPLEVIEEELRDKDAKQRALVLEMIGDLPDAEVAPPENVLFVCKLNPVTRDEDLEIIFSRFGPIVSCEVIKDDKTGDSLQYAFIEFEKQEDCEKAYFKMDNVLIDDRRIHVDFSQSVSHLKWRGKGRGVTYVNDENEPKSNRRSDDFDRGRGGNDRGNNRLSNHSSSDNHHQQRYSRNGDDHRQRDYNKTSRRSRSASRERQRHRDGRDNHDRASRDHRKERSDRKRDRSRSRDRYDDRSRDSRDHRDRDHHHKTTSSASSKYSRSEYDHRDDRRRDRDHHRDNHSKSSSKHHHRR